ncbi:MAG TPA: DUF58 domain-containing protein [Planctomycetota bacterium]|nr:DUF58 domain-containing protein [Planctomycetota bacterium]
MSQITDLFDPRALAKFANLELVARQVVEGFITGMHKSPFKGFSVEFAEHRQYTPGDEIRYIDWRAYAKTDRYYVKEFEEETNLRCFLLVDVSGSMRYSGRHISKFRYGCFLSAALAYLMLHQQDAVGMVTFDTDIRRYIPPRARPDHLRVLLQELQGTKPGGETELAGVFHGLAERIKRRGLVVMISDFFYEPAALLGALQHFRHRKHELILFHVMAPDELTFPFNGWMEFRNLEVADDRLRIDPSRMRSEYIQRVREFIAELKRGCGNMRADYVQLSTDMPFDYALARYLSARAARRK